jgi:hypothetical protein
MADNTNTKFPTHIVKFDDVKVPDSHKVEDYSNYMPVVSFNRAGHTDSGEFIKLTNGKQPVQQCTPVVITLYPELALRLNVLAGAGMKEDKKIKCIELARMNKNKHTESYEMELEGVKVTRHGETVVVEYQKYTEKSYNGDEADVGGFNFLKQEVVD